MIFRNADRFAGSCGIKLQNTRAKRGGSNGDPGARGVIFGHAAVQGDPGAGADFVAHNQRRKEVLRVHRTLCLTCRKQRGEDTASDMTFGQLVSVMRIKRVDGHATGHRGTRGADHAPIEKNLCAMPAKMLRRMTPDNPRQSGCLPSGRDANQIEQPATPEIEHLVRNVAIACLVQEVGKGAGEWHGWGLSGRIPLSSVGCPDSTRLVGKRRPTLVETMSSAFCLIGVVRLLGGL